MIGLQKLFNCELSEVHNRQRQFAIVLDPAFHGKGYGIEALNWLCKIGFQYGGLHRIQGDSFSINVAGL
jgi:RimJ/RimL family protein N-acetyltransferase